MVESIGGHSKACCNIPPIISKDYKAKGKYETIDGLKTYVTGPESAKLAILIIYDIFGYFPQTIQGADILSTSDEGHQYQVFMPDFFEGNPCDIAWYPPVNEEQKQGLYGWFPSHTPAIAIPRIPQILAAVEAKYGKKTWAGLGFCWGGKVVSVTSGTGTLFKVSAQCHPGMIASEDAAKVTIPMCFLASEEESNEEVEAFSKALTVEKHVEAYPKQVHGWMSARGNLEDEECKKAYLKGYNTVLEWFGKYID
ncbi:related to hydrolase related to dienelactone hydrolase [Phialocephala subalpina]|uniref:Related to hydrolase related to dienelactone hydrolase n=1 Tax=Phialocephala subalpina TaxID=576137 RepID=A0A1L7XG08_9HELO|nr:related to hydrolase related to dienelactone hydrolase [Phialocephala subalpina]